MRTHMPVYRQKLPPRDPALLIFIDTLPFSLAFLYLVYFLSLLFLLSPSLLPNVMFHVCQRPFLTVSPQHSYHCICCSSQYCQFPTPASLATSCCNIHQWNFLINLRSHSFHIVLLQQSATECNRVQKQQSPCVVEAGVSGCASLTLYSDTPTTQ